MEGGRAERLRRSLPLSRSLLLPLSPPVSLPPSLSLSYTFAPAVPLSVLECKHCREESGSPPLSAAKDLSQSHTRMLSCLNQKVRAFFFRLRLMLMDVFIFCLPEDTGKG